MKRTRQQRSLKTTWTWSVLLCTIGLVEAWVPPPPPTTAPFPSCAQPWQQRQMQQCSNNRRNPANAQGRPPTATHTNTRLHLSPLQRQVVAMDAATASLLSPWESWCLLRLEHWYRQALSIKCPFLRRRASDTLDALEQVLRFIVIRHKSLDVVDIGPPVGWRCEGDVCAKEKHLPTAVVMERIRNDWKTDTAKGYYITGRLSTELYRDDCLFDGPDPDMPVRGLRKYLNAASQLFETRSSTAVLLDLQHDKETDLITAKWKMQGVLRLPWKPALPEWHGTTTYHRDDEGLIYRHSETWELSVAEAFLKTLWPTLADRIWQQVQTDTDTECLLE